MKIADSLLDGLVELRARALRTALQTLGVVLGVASLVAVQGLVDAGRRRSVEYLEEMRGLTRIAVRWQRGRSAPTTARERASPGLTLDDAEAIRREVPGALFVDAGLEGGYFWLVSRSGRGGSQVALTGATRDYLAVNRASVARGRFLTDSDLASLARVCVLGSAAAEEHFGGSDPIGRVLYLGNAGFTVVGVLGRREFYFSGSDRNAFQRENRSVILPATTLVSRFLGWASRNRRSAFELSVIVDRPDRVRPAVRAIETLLLRRHGGVRDFQIHDARSLLETEGERRRTFDVTFLAVGAVSLLVGGIVIMNIMLASLHERVREVGLRRACGAGRGDIAVQFLTESFLVAAVGAGAGLLIGTLFTRAVSTFVERPALITPGMALVSLLASVGVGLLFGLYPAVRASRLSPVAALRYE